jgi:hypothetical protein
MLVAKLCLPDWVREFQMARAKYNLALGNTAAARKHLSTSRQSSTALVDMEQIRDVDYDARISLLEGDGAAAATLLQHLFQTVPATWPRAIAHRTGSWTLARSLVERWCPTDDEMSELLRIHHMARQMAHHDLYVLALSHVLELRGELPRFFALWDEYVTKHRFERGPLLSQLSLRVATLLGADDKSQAFPLDRGAATPKNFDAA